jgi:hypothetical protein
MTAILTGNSCGRVVCSYYRPVMYIGKIVVPASRFTNCEGLLEQPFHRTNIGISQLRSVNNLTGQMQWCGFLAPTITKHIKSKELAGRLDITLAANTSMADINWALKEV